MPMLPLTSTPTRRRLWLLAALSGVFAVQAQPSGNSPNTFGDRQVGQWGDPGQGNFGNPAAGDFDKSQIKTPPQGARPLGRVYNGKPPEASPYLSLPTPADAADAVPVEAPAKPKAAQPVADKKPGKKKTAKAKTTN